MRLISADFLKITWGLQLWACAKVYRKRLANRWGDILRCAAPC